MKHFSAQKLIVSAFALALFGAGCFAPATPAKGPDGGVWKTKDGGLTWASKKAYINGPSLTATAATFTVGRMMFDPQDHNTVYIATGEAGLVYSTDGGDSWQSAKIPGLTAVTAIAVDPKNKCTVYATSGNKIYKTTTCTRDWAQIFFEPRTNIVFTQLVVDWFNPTNLYAGSSDGDFYKSVDAGVSWQKIHRVDGVAITSLAIDHNDSRILYYGTDGEGIWKTVDAGLTWVQIKKEFGDEFRDARRVIQLVLDPVEANVVYEVSRYGIIKSMDGGTTWKGLNLTSPPGSIKIYAMAVDPKNNKHLVYTGVSTLQFTTDGGLSWTPKKLPTAQIGSTLLYDPMDSNVIYLGTVAPPKSQN